MVQEPDPRLLKGIQRAEEERQRRITAERQANILRAQNSQLRRKLKQLTTDALPSCPVPPGNLSH